MIPILMKRCEVILGQFLADENDLGMFKIHIYVHELVFFLIILMSNIL